MSPARAIRHEWKRVFDFSGRTARAAYLWYLLFCTTLFGASLPLCGQLARDDASLMVSIGLVTLIFYVPVTSAGVRRLHDVGQSGLLMLDPLKPFLALAIFLMLAMTAVVATEIGAFVGLMAAFFFSGIVIVSLVIVCLAALFLTLTYFSHTMGLLLLPSDPGPNKYGPNPNEVPL